MINKNKRLIIIVISLLALIVFTFFYNHSQKDNFINKIINNYCTSESRQAGVCLALHQPVCGWFNSSIIKCIKYPCVQTYSNDCFACKDTNVEYWTDGECLK